MLIKYGNRENNIQIYLESLKQFCKENSLKGDFIYKKINHRRMILWLTTFLLAAKQDKKQKPHISFSYCWLVGWLVCSSVSS